MRFKKIVFGLILSLLLAFPTYADVLPISAGNAGVESIIQPRGSHRWSGDGYPFPPYRYETSAPQYRGINGNVTFTLNPGETIRINARYGRQSSYISLRSSGGLPYKYAQDYLHSNTSTSYVAGHAWFVTMDNTSGDKVVQLFMPAHKEGSDSEGHVRVPDTYYTVTLRPAPHPLLGVDRGTRASPVELTKHFLLNYAHYNLYSEGDILHTPSELYFRVTFFTSNKYAV